MFYTQHISNGNIALNASRDYEKALREYRLLLLLDEDSIDAIFGVANALVSLSTLDVSRIAEAMLFLRDNEAKITVNPEYYPEIAKHFVMIALKIDSYVSRSFSLLATDGKYLDSKCRDRHREIVVETKAFWSYLSDFFSRYPLGSDLLNREAIEGKNKLIDDELSAIDHSVPLSDVTDVFASLPRAIFASRKKTYIARIVFSILQIAFVIGAIIGFIIMMANYQNDPFPGLIVLGIFALLFALANIINRVLKIKLLK